LTEKILDCFNEKLDFLRKQSPLRKGEIIKLDRDSSFVFMRKNREKYFIYGGRDLKKDTLYVPTFCLSTRNVLDKLKFKFNENLIDFIIKDLLKLEKAVLDEFVNENFVITNDVESVNRVRNLFHDLNIPICVVSNIDEIYPNLTLIVKEDPSLFTMGINNVEVFGIKEAIGFFVCGQ